MLRANDMLFLSVLSLSSLTPMACNSGAGSYLWNERGHHWKHKQEQRVGYVASVPQHSSSELVPRIGGRGPMIAPVLGGLVSE